MLNIAESVPSNSGISIIIQYNTSSQHWPSSVKLPEFRELTELGQWRVGLLYWMTIEFPELDGTGSGGRNWFHNVQNCGIGWLLRKFHPSLLVRIQAYLFKFYLKKPYFYEYLIHFIVLSSMHFQYIRLSTIKYTNYL
jgi:hypothetical protein